MDQNQQIKALFAIVQQQQKVIEKLAQLTNQQLPPQRIEPQKSELRPADLVLSKLDPATRALLRPTMPIVPKGTNLLLFFQPNKASQQAVDHITKVVQNLVSKNELPFAYSVQAAV